MNTNVKAARVRWSVLTALLAVAGSGWAHHGWSWAEEKQTTLEGTVQSVSMAPPHPRLQVVAGDGSQWQIDLGNPSQTARSGFNGQSAAGGDRIVVLGNRSKEPGQRLMKAVRITLDGKHYDLYPERLASTP